MGFSFDHYSQNDITLMINHINSVPRKKLVSQTPHDLKTFFIDDKFIEVFKLEKINYEDIILKDKLFKQKR